MKRKWQTNGTKLAGCVPMTCKGEKVYWYRPKVGQGEMDAVSDQAICFEKRRFLLPGKSKKEV